jgi:hypothetical protein
MAAVAALHASDKSKLSRQLLHSVNLRRASNHSQLHTTGIKIACEREHCRTGIVGSERQVVLCRAGTVKAESALRHAP